MSRSNGKNTKLEEVATTDGICSKSEKETNFNSGADLEPNIDSEAEKELKIVLKTEKTSKLDSEVEKVPKLNSAAETEPHLDSEATDESDLGKMDFDSRSRSRAECRDEFGGDDAIAQEVQPCHPRSRDQQEPNTRTQLFFPPQPDTGFSRTNLVNACGRSEGLMESCSVESRIATHPGGAMGAMLEGEKSIPSLNDETIESRCEEENERRDAPDSDKEFVEVDEIKPDLDIGTENLLSLPSGKSLEANPWKEYETDDACEIEERIDFEDALLIERMKAFARAARDLSDSAVSESQQLLQLFGIPFIVSPQEAESQCAYLDSCGMTMGTITDDSDVLLFGGRVVFKGIFDRRQDPVMYSAAEIKADLGLDRRHLINIALCSGSDYTVGIENAGPVAALEVMQEFPGEGVESLMAFKKWWEVAHRQVKAPSNETKIKSRLRKLNLPPDFPSQLVVDAYLKPVINESKETFTWGIPDLDAIRNFLIERLNWTKGKVDESLLPVLKRAAERKQQKQTFISSFFIQGASQKKKKKSKRVTRAVTAISQSLHGGALQKKTPQAPERRAVVLSESSSDSS